MLAEEEADVAAGAVFMLANQQSNNGYDDGTRALGGGGGEELEKQIIVKDNTDIDEVVSRAVRVECHHDGPGYHRNRCRREFRDKVCSFF